MMTRTFVRLTVAIGGTAALLLAGGAPHFARR